MTTFQVNEFKFQVKFIKRQLFSSDFTNILLRVEHNLSFIIVENSECDFIV